MLSAFLHPTRDHLSLLDMTMGCGLLSHWTAKAIPSQNPFPPYAEPLSFASMGPRFSFSCTTRLNAYQVPPHFSCNKDLTTSSVFASFIHFTISKFTLASSNLLEITSCLEAIFIEPSGSCFCLFLSRMIIH